MKSLSRKILEHFSKVNEKFKSGLEDHVKVGDVFEDDKSNKLYKVIKLIPNKPETFGAHEGKVQVIDGKSSYTCKFYYNDSEYNSGKYIKFRDGREATYVAHPELLKG